MWRPIIIFSMVAMMVNGFGSDDRFLKKYALIKIFESCFGQDVVKEIRKELKSACIKCALMEARPVLPPPQSTSHPTTQSNPEGIAEPENSVYANQQTIPSEKLHQAILAFRPNPYPQPSFRPYPGSAASFYQAFANPGPMYYNPNYVPNPFASSPYGFPFVNQPYYGNSRMSRDMDFKAQLELLSTRLGSRVKNITCVMQELGYLDENLEPNYSKISERIASLPVAQELRNDIQEGVTYCQQFSQCIPDPKKQSSPLSRELTKPMLFFKCYKYKKMEACIMKDVREKFSNISEEDLDGENDFRRTGKSIKNDEEIDVLASSLYDFLYGDESDIDADSVL